METESSPRIWAVSDGRAGNVATSSGLAHRVAALTGGAIERKDVALGTYAAKVPPAVWSVLPTRWALAQGKPSIAPPFPDLAIGAGRRVAPIVSALTGRGVRTVQILDPQMSPGRFDLVAAPEHDRLEGANVLQTLGSMHRITPDLLSAEDDRWRAAFANLPRPLVAILIGGTTRRTAVEDDAVGRFAEDLHRLGKAGAGLVITASRRTGAEQAARLRAALPEAWFWDDTGDNPYFGMLACADAIIVTDDSVNMVTEACATGKPVAIYPLIREGGKIARFHETLIARGHAEWFDERVPHRSGKLLDETSRVAQAVAKLL